MVKTNAMRILDSNKIDYKVMSYEVKSEHVDGVGSSDNSCFNHNFSLPLSKISVPF